jgi:ubiquitin carboxyl-terminal hydrolase 7
MAQFLDEHTDKSESWVYDLYGVVVHSGELSGGHYFCFLKPSSSEWWLKFDHGRVVPVVEREVLHNGYGGNEVGGRPTSAYALFYLRRTRKEELLTPILDSEIPNHLSLCPFSFDVLTACLTVFTRTCAEHKGRHESN